ncbi:MAG: hypothetical protein M9920_05885 [Verrucomicrobiae bacterium]|nr:hypothetical protein [Verrucomicrobiae bacterium]
MKSTPLRLGLFGIGLDTYWPQFKGLKNRLQGYQRRIAARIRAFGMLSDYILDLQGNTAATS